MFSVIDEVSEKIGDGAYLELANQFKKLMEFKDKIRPASKPITILDLMRHTSGMIYGVFAKKKPH